jgi:sec-independent protein translocase protein TatB
MFGVDFSEMLVIAVVALIVIGPERLPRVARAVGHLMGRAQRYVSDVKADINREMHMEDLKTFQQQVVDQVGEMQSAFSKEMKGVESGLNQAIEPEAKPETETNATPTLPDKPA